MKATEAAKLLANRINQEHYILHIMQKVYEAGVKEGMKQDSEQTATLPPCDVCGSTDVIEAPHMGRNCNFCNPIF
jgi:hypothetical protein